MRLFIKFVNGQPVRLGVDFPTEFQGFKSYQELLNNYRGEELKARFELSYGRINLRLSPVSGSGHVDYKGLEFNPDHLSKLRAFFKVDSSMEFVHIFWKENSPFVAKPRFKKPELLFIRQCEVISADVFGA